jgi:hypothetical protein
LGQLFLQLADFAVGVINIAHVPGQDRVPQVAGGNVVADPALGYLHVGLDVLIQDIGVLPLLYAHQNQGDNDNNDGYRDGDSITHDQAFPDLHIFDHLPLSSSLILGSLYRNL